MSPSWFATALRSSAPRLCGCRSANPGPPVVDGSPAVAHCDYARLVLVSTACARIVDVAITLRVDREAQRGMHRPAAFGGPWRVLGVVKVRVDLDAPALGAFLLAAFGFHCLPFA